MIALLFALLTSCITPFNALGAHGMLPHPPATIRPADVAGGVSGKAAPADVAGGVSGKAAPADVAGGVSGKAQALDVAGGISG